MKISVIITNWNGLNILQKNFQTILKNSPEASEFIFADDFSEDDSVQYISELQKKYNKIKIIANTKNIGFGENSNNAVRQATGDYVVLLNNDIRPNPGYIKNALNNFSDKNVAGVGFAEYKHENWAKIFWKDGYLQHEPGLDVSKNHISAWISGGSSIINRKIFLKFGGFDPVYSPFYSEDLDLGYRLWKSGYKLLWEPTSIVEHKHESTTSKFPKRLLNYVKERNRLLTVWRNITDPGLLFQNKIAIIGRVLSGPNYIKIIRAANKQIATNQPPVVFPKLSDKEIFDLFSK